MTNNNKLTLADLAAVRRLGIEEARKGISNTATVYSILKGIGSKLISADLTYEQIAVLNSYYDKGVAIGKAE